jgi:hypothetical protein
MRASRGVLVRSRDLVLLEEAIEAGADGREPARHRLVGDVDHHDVESSDGARLRDAVAHGSGADDADFRECAHGCDLA